MKLMTRFTVFVLLFTLIAGAQLVFTEQASSAAFTPGDLVVYRVGDPLNPITTSGTSAPIFLDEYTTTGSLVQSIAVPPSGTNMMTASMTAKSEGLITLSADGNYLMFTGYNAPSGTASVASSSGATYPREVGKIDASANISTRTLGPTTFSGNNIRGATSSNGSNVWVSGVADSTNLGGVFYLSFSGTGETQLATSPNDSRQVAIYNGQLYISTDKSSFKGVDTVGSFLPTTSGQTVTRLAGLTNTIDPSDYGFFMADLNPSVPGLDTLYIADDDSGAYGGLKKFFFNGTSWIACGIVGSAADTYRGLTGSVSGSTVTLYATRKGGGGVSGGGELVSLVDLSGFSGTFSGTPNFLHSADLNTAFRGVAFVPVPEPSAFIVLVTGFFAGLGYLRLRRKHNA
jgi:hypothetical protein